LRDPAVGTRSYMEPGAVRLKVATAWGFPGDGQDHPGTFFSIYTVDDGILRSKSVPPQLDAVTQALAKYDRDSAGGSYVIEGMRVVRGADLADGRQDYSVTEGRARVNGYGVERDVSRRIVYDAQPDVLFVDSEPHVSTGPNAHRVDFDRHPAGAITQVRITTERTVTVTHGAFTGAADPLPDNAVISIVSVSQNQTTYEQGTDYRLTAGQVDWSPSGTEPAPGSSYSVTYLCITSISPVDPDEKGLTVGGAVEGSLILLSYEYLLPRYDRLALASDGEIVWIKGVAAQWNPVVPSVPAALLPLATVYQSWDARSSVIDDTIRAVRMDELYALNDRLDHIIILLAQQRLEASADRIEAGMKKGLLVDPFLDESIRDAGAGQTALILDGELQLDIAVAVFPLTGDITGPRTLDHLEDVVLVAQPLKTGDMRINPYDAFDPIPNQVTLTPAFDAWTSTQKIGSTTVKKGSGNSVSVSTSLSNVGSRALDTMRSIQVAYDIRGWGVGETVSLLHFDGIAVTPNGQANTDGRATGRFQIPADVPAGKKEVTFIGTQASFARATYEGSQTVIEQWETRTETWTSVDPLAQTFSLDATSEVGAVDLWFTDKDANAKVVVQIREVVGGVPTRNVLASVYVAASAIVTNGNPTRIQFDVPVHLAAETEYALVILCDDAATRLALAELGKYDVSSSTFVTSQPYQIGVLLSSSNASTWTAHQDKDLTFRILCARFTETDKPIPLGSAEVTDATDLVVLSPSSRPASTARVSYRVTLPDATVLTVDSGQRIQLSEQINGTVTVSALLSGTPTVAPIIWPGTQLVNGAMELAGDYITRAILAGQDSNVKVIFEALIPAGASVTPSIAGVDPDDEWLGMTLERTQPFDDGFVELTYALEDVDETMIRARLILTGTPAARPRVRNLRVIVT
jgi:hypothetical protein